VELGWADLLIQRTHLFNLFWYEEMKCKQNVSAHLQQFKIMMNPIHQLSSLKPG
jgi:hypothetical protein